MPVSFVKSVVLSDQRQHGGNRHFSRNPIRPLISYVTLNQAGETGHSLKKG